MRSIRDLFPGRKTPRPEAITIELAPGVPEPTEESLSSILEYGYMPGETVQLRGDDRPVPHEPDAEAAYEARKALAGRVLTVVETIVEVISDSHARVWHRFDGVDGRYTAVAMTSPGIVDQPYGVVLEHDDAVWLVGLSDVDGQVVGDPKKITGLGRPIIRQFFSEMNRKPSVRDILVTDVEGPIAGEFFCNSEDDGHTWIMVASPWSSLASEVEVATARASLEAPSLRP